MHDVKLFLQAVLLVGLYSGVWFALGVELALQRYERGAHLKKRLLRVIDGWQPEQSQDEGGWEYKFVKGDS